MADRAMRMIGAVVWTGVWAGCLLVCLALLPLGLLGPEE